MHKKIIIPIISQSDFINKLKKRPFENLEIIRNIEQFLLKKRGYIFRMPKPGTSVILSVSGGLDSTTTWALLLEKYKLKVYPIFVFRDRNRSYREEEAAQFFSRYFQKHYPGKSFDLMKFSTILSPPELMQALKNPKAYYHPKQMLNVYAQNKGVDLSPNFYPQRILPILHVFYCMVYSEYLYDHLNIKINTIFQGIMTGDGTVVPSQTFTSLRSALLSMCSITDNYQWQYTSLAMEKELKHWLEKSDFIKLGKELSLPLEKTWSCYKAGKSQCGDECLACHSRKLEFAKAGIIDKTKYTPEKNFQKRIRKSLKKHLTNIFRHFTMYLDI